jgi:methylmalonyl-CoA mutase
MLKSTSAAMSAIIGGCNALWVEPEDESALARRIALNVSSILKEEAYFGHIIDPSFGSYYVEQYSHQIAMDGWKMFVNKTGG